MFISVFKFFSKKLRLPAGNIRQRFDTMYHAIYKAIEMSVENKYFLTAVIASSSECLSVLIASLHCGLDAVVYEHILSLR